MSGSRWFDKSLVLRDGIRLISRIWLPNSNGPWPAFELEDQGLFFRRQVLLPVTYKEMKLDTGYRIDLLVEEKVIVEMKSIEEFNPIHLAQVLTYLKLSNLKLGLLLNFNVVRLTDGIKRVVNNL